MPVHRGKVISEAVFRRMWRDPSISTQEIAQEIGITVQAVRGRAKSRGLSCRPKRKPYNRRIEPDMLRLMWEGNVRAADIAAFFGVHPTCIGKRRRAWKIPDRKCHRYNSISLASFILSRDAKETEAAYDRAGMCDRTRKAA